MTPKEKAEELVDRFDNIDVLGEEHNSYIAARCASIAIDEILKAGQDVDEFADSFWQEVKQEIEKL